MFFLGLSSVCIQAGLEGMTFRFSVLLRFRTVGGQSTDINGCGSDLAQARGRNGKRTVNVVPTSSWLSQRISP